jgi:hypothetical protein
MEKVNLSVLKHLLGKRPRVGQFEGPNGLVLYEKKVEEWAETLEHNFNRLEGQLQSLIVEAYEFVRKHNLDNDIFTHPSNPKASIIVHDGKISVSIDLKEVLGGE